MLEKEFELESEKIVTYKKENPGADKFYFSHANGFSGKVYNKLLSNISDSYEVITYDMRGHGNTTLKADPNKLKSWYTFKNDLIELIKIENKPVVLSGHSMGGTASLLVALSNPDLVSKLILVDPVMLPLRYILTYKFLQFTGLSHLVNPLAKNASIRRNGWSSKDDAFQYFSKKNLFKHIDEQIIRDYVEYCTYTDQDNELKLKCEPSWESACFKLTSHEVWFDLKRINIPLKIILTPNSVVCNKLSQKRIKKYNPQTEICFIKDTSHMLPLEKTTEVSREINNFL